MADPPHRVIQELEWAKSVEQGPWGRSLPRGAKALGLRFERNVGEALPGAIKGQWFRFMDRNGPGYCQTDVLLRGASSVLVLECKYTWTPDGNSQIDQLYRPVVEMAWKLPVLGVQVCRLLRPGMEVPVVHTLVEAVELARQGGLHPCLHWPVGAASFAPQSYQIKKMVA